MDLNGLKASVLEQAHKTKDLANTERDLKNEIKNIVKKNFCDIVKPFMTDMNELIYDIHNLADVSATNMNDRKLFCDVEGRHISLKKYWGGMYPNLYDKGSANTRSLSIDILNDDLNINNGWLLYLDKWFLTEEDSQKFVEACKVEYVDILNKYSALVSERNEKLSKSIDKLSEELSKSSCVSHKEDGTVEIHLGGKTYTATLKESE